MADPAPLRLTVDRLVAGGDALGRDEGGRVVFVEGALPGEVVEVEVVEARRDFARARLLQVVTASPDRIEPPCPARLDGCGGCDWMHLGPERQLDAKAAVVADAVRRVARREPPPLTATGSVAATGYRTTVRVVGDAQHRAAYRRGASDDTVVADPCLVAHPLVRQVLPGLRVAPGVELTVRVSAATGSLTAWWDGPDGAVAGLPPATATGPSAALVEHVAGHPLQVSARSFFQSGPAAAELLVTAVRRAAPELDRGGHVVDAYGGVGLFAVAAAPTARITLVESSRSATADARVNLAGRRARVVRTEFGRWRPVTGEHVDVVVADPARPGLGRPGVAAVARTRAATVVLVSCDPASAARDLGLLAAEGYRADRMEVLDLFPGTHHVEVVTRFTRHGGESSTR